MGASRHRISAKGINNAVCDVCGVAYKSNELSKRWDNKWVCVRDMESRHPLDFIKGINDQPPVTIDRPDIKGTETVSALVTARVLANISNKLNTQPAVPASGVNSTNNGRTVFVYIYGGTVTQITLRGVATNETYGTFILQPTDTISITYSVAPSWVWYG